MEGLAKYINSYRKSGDRKWFTLIYQEIMPRIYRFYYFKTMDRELSEDLVSEVFIRVYGNLRKTDLNERSFMVWIYRIASNLLIDHFRKNTGNTQPLEPVLNQIKITDEEFFKKNSSLFRKEFSFENAELIAALSRLTKLQKDVLFLRFVEDIDYKTIAGILNKSKGTIRGIIFRAMEILRKEIGKNNE